MARSGALEYDTQQGDYNVFSDSEEVVPFLNYRPVNPLYRY
jgi:hypothetical protein